MTVVNFAVDLSPALMPWMLLLFAVLQLMVSVRDSGRYLQGRMTSNVL